MAQSPVRERAARGRSMRAEMPRSSHAQLPRPEDRRDPVELLAHQARDRVPELVPIRHGRMLASPFAFYRGAAIVMAADLALTPRTGRSAQQEALRAAVAEGRLAATTGI